MRIQGVKIGNTVNFTINGKLRKKSFVNENDAHELFNAILIAKENPTMENIANIETFYNKNLRVSLHSNLEIDENNNIFLNGFNTPIPSELVDVFEEYHKNKYPSDAIKNFWMLLMANPDERVRNNLFKFIKEHDFSITDNGYMVVYKAVFKKEMSDLDKYVGKKYNTIKSVWKKNPNDYIVYMDGKRNKYYTTKISRYNNWCDDKKETLNNRGYLNELYSIIGKTAYTDMHTQSMNIEIGKPVYMDRKECDSNPEIDCSYGLHVGATKYVEWFANSDSDILICLVNPMNVVAVPNYDHSKIRVSEYYPIALAKYENGKIGIIEEAYFENDYATIEKLDLEVMLNKIKQNQKPFETSINAKEETRSISELMKIIENRLVDISS